MQVIVKKIMCSVFLNSISMTVKLDLQGNLPKFYVSKFSMYRSLDEFLSSHKKTVSVNKNPSVIDIL